MWLYFSLIFGLLASYKTFMYGWNKPNSNWREEEEEGKRGLSIFEFTRVTKRKQWEKFAESLYSYNGITIGRVPQILKIPQGQMRIFGLRTEY